MNTMMNFVIDQVNEDVPRDLFINFSKLDDGSKDLLVKFSKLIAGRAYGEVEPVLVILLVSLSDFAEKTGLAKQKDILENIIKYFKVIIEGE